MATAPTLYREIDALGGLGGGERHEGYTAALTDVLAILERRGFSEAADAEAIERCERRFRIQRALIATLGDTYDCTRVWSAWGVGTMDQDDFVPILDRLEELVDEIDMQVFEPAIEPVSA